MQPIRFALALAVALVTPACFAHGELPEPEWCADGRPVAVASFELFAENLIDLRDQCSTDSASTKRGPSTKECGQFDDDYDIGRRTAMATCSAYEAARIGPGDIGSVIVLVDSPSTYLDDAHHDLYRVEQGLVGTCVRCESRLRPVDPIRIR